MEFDQPPIYSPVSPSAPSPLYSERPATAERVLQSEHHPTGLAPAAPEGAKHVYKTDHLEIRLHPPHWGLVLPAYGSQGTVDGIVTFRKQCSHVLELSVSLIGAINTSATQHATVAVPGVSRAVILKKKAVLFTAAGKSETLRGDYPFAIRFPELTADGADLLPPSYTVYQPGITTEVFYTFRVDITRKSFRRHERFSTHVLYLPKTRPTLPPVEALPWAHVENSLERMCTVPLMPVWNPKLEEAARRRDDLPQISVTMPDSKCFASGEVISIALEIACPSAPALARLLSHNAHLTLVKRQKTWISLGAQISIREQVLSRADIYLADESQEGTAYLRLEVQAGEAARESTWKVHNVVAVEHILRLLILPPSHLENFPMFKYEVPLQITTDQYGTLQSEILAMGGVPFPALGLNDVQRYLRPNR
ncbi:uncharacterized protein BXZ73DRAFT_60000 [Epithele typhae]|uniref:uncharacterized protein n=2 Tax=Epithele typhae TaxID=378194 RepID=UPI0020079BE3|nr:uncharacterized protein BXZ73DRAFT_60000 [Epithele typhae]KAH9908251.1 hypothetical protein BXZ73DRAFT_60000 [Epithele typhae]